MTDGLEWNTESVFPGLVDSNYINKDLLCFAALLSASFWYDMRLLTSGYECVVELFFLLWSGCFSWCSSAAYSSTHPPPWLIDATTEMETREVQKGWFQPHQGAEVYAAVVITAATALVDMLWSFGSQSLSIQQDWVALLRLVNMACQSLQNSYELMSVLQWQMSTTSKLKVTPSSTNDWLQKVT